MELDSIVSNKYSFREGIYFIGEKHFSYSDGDADEIYVKRVIDSATDISSDSDELEKSIKNWSSRYHLSSDRANCYRSFQFPKDCTVLEIGSGCGAISRYLGERVGQLLSLEGSPRRAAITRSRTRDLNNVAVLCASFQDIQFIGKFDYVICNGVLEYAPLFIQGTNAVNAFIEALSLLVKSSGSVIIAIENKFGLRYFSSGMEEHTGVMYDGLEDYQRFPGGPRTFGRDELNNKLLNNFNSVEFFLPLPDYKFPKAIIRESLCDLVNCSELFSSLDIYDFSTAINPLLHERLAWRSLSESGLLRHFSNSFFIIAGATPEKLTRENWFGDIYSRNRLPEFGTQTSIFRHDNGEICTQKKSSSRTVNHPANGSSLALNETIRSWIPGSSIHTLVVESFVRKSNIKLHERLKKPIVLWWSSVREHLDNNNTLPANMIDSIWQNSISDSGQVKHFDDEWSATNRISPLLLIYRSVICFTGRELPFVHRWSSYPRNTTQVAIIKSIAQIVGVRFSLGLLFSTIKEDIEFAKDSRGIETGALRNLIRLYLPISFLRVKSSSAAFSDKVISRIIRRFA